MYIELDLPYMYSKMLDWTAKPLQCTEVRFASLLSGGFITAVVVNQPERKLAKRTSVHCSSALLWAKIRCQNSALVH